MLKNTNRMIVSSLILSIILTVGVLAFTIYQLNARSNQPQPSATDLREETTRQLLDLLVDARGNEGTGADGSQLLNLLVDARASERVGGNAAQLLDLLVDARLNERTRANADAEQATALVGNVAQAAPAEVIAPMPTAPAQVISAPITPTPTAPAPAVDYIFSYLPARAECTTATQIAAQLLKSWGYHILLEQVPTSAELFNRLTSTAATERRTNVTFCYSDPEDRGFFTTYLNQLSIIGNGYYNDGITKLYMVSQNGLAAQLDERDHCLFEFFQNFNDHAIDLQGQSATDFLFDHPEEVQAWGNCFGHKGETKVEHEAHKNEAHE